MDGFFNEAVAARLQYVTFPLEAIGLTLALIELRYPRAAAWLTRRIERLATPMDALRQGGEADQGALERSLEALLSRLLTAGFVVLTGVYFLRGLHGLVAGHEDWGWAVGLFVEFLVVAITMIVVLVLLGLAAWFLVVGGSDFANRFVAGRAIGTLGLLIAGLGLLGEAYQFFTQLLS